MENFTNTNLNLILGVKEGCHFDRVQKPIIILATLNGQCLETKKIPPDCNPQFATDLIWETDKNALRKMRCNLTPIKIECYAVNDNGSREKIGYILLNVRCAQIIHPDEDSKIKMNWYNILGVRNEFNNCKPKLMLYLIIKEKETKAVEIPSKEKELHEATLIYSNILPKWSQEEHLIQLGPIDTCQDIFLLYITAETLTNLGQIIQEFKGNNNNDFTLIYNIFDMFFKLKSFKLESDNIYLNQKIVIKIRSSVNVLANYLNLKSRFFVKLKNNSVTVADSEINLNSLLASSNQHYNQINKFTMSARECHCILKNIYFNQNKGDHEKDKHDEFPSLKIHIKLLLQQSKEITINNKSEALASQYLPLNLKNKDILSQLNQHHYPEEQTHDPDFNNRIQSISCMEKFVHFTEPNSKSSVQNKESSNESIDNYRTYCLNIKLKSIKFSSSMPDVKNIEFRFYNPKGDLVTTISNNVFIEAEQMIKLQDVKCNLHFIATSDKIEELLSTFAPKINVCDTTSDDKKCLAQALFDFKKLFQQEKHECQYTQVLKHCSSQNEIGFLDICAVLEDCTMSSQNKIHEDNFGITFNNKLAYKIVDELENWKERQKEIFKEELQKREESHLTLLNEEWQRRRQCLESKLSSSIQQCKVLANNLSKTIDDLRKRKIQSFEKETQLIQANEESQWKYERKLRQLQEALEKMQAEFIIKLRTLEEQNKSLICQIESLNAKNYELEIVKTEQIEKLSTLKKTLSEDQKISVLQQLKNLEEKLDIAQKSKNFFKEQWDSAVKEIHKLKIENQKALESQIKSSKEELHNFDLEEILQADSAALTYDQIALNEIQREIDVMNPKSNRLYLNIPSKEKSLAPQSDVCLSLDYDLAKSDFASNANTINKKIHMMIEERDALLKTGSYTSEDDIIVKLNADIRSLLMSN